MCKRKALKKAQSTLEYAIIIAVVMAGLWFMQNYIKRGYQGKLRDAADSMGESYDPGDVESRFCLTTNSTVIQSNLNKTQRTHYRENQISSKFGYENLSNWSTSQNVYRE